MFSILGRYVGRSIFNSSMLVLLVLLSLVAVFAFIGELDDVGRGNYDVKTAALYILLKMPVNAYQLFAPAVLLGSLLGLGTLATHSELVAMRAAGVSIQRIMWAVMQVGLVLMLIIVLIGEYVAPRAEQYAQEIRLSAMQKKVSVRASTGLWLKKDDLFINIKTVMPDRSLLNLSVFKYENHRMMYAMSASHAVQNANKQWQLRNVQYTDFSDAGISVRKVEQETWDELVNPELLQNLSVEPENLSAKNLLRQVNYMKQNQLESERIQLALWTKLTGPLATIVMLMLSLPFVFSSQRSSGAGQRIFIGIMLGIGYILINRLFTHMGLVYGFPPAISALTPLLIFLTVAIIGIRRIG